MSDDHNVAGNTNQQEKEYSSAEIKYHSNIENLSPLATVCIITLIGLVCVVIDFYLEAE